MLLSASIRLHAQRAASSARALPAHAGSACKRRAPLRPGSWRRCRCAHHTRMACQHTSRAASGRRRCAAAARGGAPRPPGAGRGAGACGRWAAGASARGSGRGVFAQRHGAAAGGGERRGAGHKPKHEQHCHPRADRGLISGAAAPPHARGRLAPPPGPAATGRGALGRGDGRFQAWNTAPEAHPVAASQPASSSPIRATGNTDRPMAPAGAPGAGLVLRSCGLSRPAARGSSAAVSGEYPLGNGNSSDLLL